MNGRLRRLLRDPLCRFLLGGAALSLAFGAFDPEQASRLIVVSHEEQAGMAREYAEEFLQVPDREAMRALVDDRIEEDVLYREAQRLDLGQDDPVIRKRLIQKMRLIVESDAEPAPPDHATLADWYAAHEAQYTVEGDTSFRHLFFASRPDLPPARRRARDVLTTLSMQPGAAVHTDPFLAGSHFSRRDDAAIDGQFGPGFARQLAEVPAGRWVGPLESAYGVHLVYVESRQPRRRLPLDTVEQAVRDDWHRDALERRQQAVIDAIVTDYTVRVEGPYVPSPDMTRMAARDNTGGP